MNNYSKVRFTRGEDPIDKYTLESLNRLINYVYDEEERHYGECFGGDGTEETEDERKNHIFTYIKVVDAWVKETMKSRKLI